MTRTLTADYTAPDPAGHFAGAKIFGDYPPNEQYDWPTVALALNYAMARLHAEPVFGQPFYDDLLQQTAAGYTRACTWYVPKLTDQHTSITATAMAVRAGVGGDVRFRSINGAVTVDTLDLAAPSPVGWISGSLNMGFDADGICKVEMWVRGNGADAVTVQCAGGQWNALTDPLAITIDGQPIWSHLELEDGEGLTGRKVNRMISQLTSLLARRRVYWSWSGIENSSNAAASWAMPSWPHRARVPVYPGTSLEGYKLRAHVLATGLVGVASKVVIAHGDYESLASDRTEFAIASGAAQALYSTQGTDIPDTIQLPDYPDNTPYMRRAAYLGIWPGEQTTAEVNSVMISGV